MIHPSRKSSANQFITLPMIRQPEPQYRGIFAVGQRTR